MLILHSDSEIRNNSPREPVINRTVFTMSVLGSTLGNFIMGVGGVLLSPEVICDNNHNERGDVNVLGADK